MIRPNNIPGLKIWLDASDVSTINNGRISDIDSNPRSHLYIPRQTVSKIVDKISGYEFTNPSGLTGPSYIFNGVNGKNAIHFPYYPPIYTNPTSLSTLPPFSISEKALIAQGLTALSTGTYSLYYVFKPSEVRGVTGSRDMWAFTIWNGDIIPTITSTSSLLSTYPDRGLKMIGMGNNTIWTWGNIKPVSFNQNGDITYHETLNNSLTSSTSVSDTHPQYRRFNKKGEYYQYGKTHISALRSSQNVKKYKIVRKDYTLDDNFLPRKTLNTSDVITVNNPTMVIGSYWPGRDGVGITVSRTVDDFLSPFEGYFCEFLFFDRVLSDVESNVIENYLKDKWIPSQQESVITDGLSLYLDPGRLDCYDGVGPRVFDLSDSRIIGSVSGTMSINTSTYSGVFVSNNNNPSPFMRFQRDNRLSFFLCDGMTVNMWIMPRYTDGEWYNRPNGTSSTYPNDRGAYPFSFFRASQSGLYSHLLIDRRLWTGTFSYDPVTNPGNWSIYFAPWNIQYDTASLVSGTSSLPGVQLENYKWHLVTAIIDRNTPVNNFAWPIKVYFDGILVGSKIISPQYQQGFNWQDYSNADWILGGSGGYSWFNGTPFRGLKGYYGLSCIYNRPFTTTEVQEFFNMTKSRYGR